MGLFKLIADPFFYTNCKYSLAIVINKLDNHISTSYYHSHGKVKFYIMKTFCKSSHFYSGCKFLCYLPSGIYFTKLGIYYDIHPRGS